MKVYYSKSKKSFNILQSEFEENDEVAQVLRQAQIVIEDMKLNDVTFLLTNSIDWSFGMAKKMGDKIEVAWTTHFNIAAHPEELVKVYQLFKKILTA